jgi:hypothetical protein
VKKPSSSVDNCNRVRNIAKLCYLACDEAVAIIEFLEPGNAAELEAAFERGSGHLPILVRKAMMQRLLMAIMRMYDQPGSDRETLPRAFELLGAPNVYQTICSGGDKLQLDAAIELWTVMQNDPELTKMRTVRNFELAHTIPSKAGKARPQTMNFLRVTQHTITLAEKLAAGTGITCVSLDHAKGTWAQRATAYWSHFLPGRRPLCIS